MPARPGAVTGPATAPGPEPLTGLRPAAGPAAGTAIYRVDWVPGTDRLAGTCHCGATAEAEDPALIWHWLLAHPAHPARPDPGP